MVKLKYMSIYRKLHISFKMKKFILFQNYFIIITILLSGCFNISKETSSSMIVLKEAKCENCYQDIKNIITSNKGIVDYSISLSQTKNQDKYYIIILIEHNYQLKLENFKSDLSLKGYTIDESE